MFFFLLLFCLGENDRCNDNQPNYIRPYDIHPNNFLLQDTTLMLSVTNDPIMLSVMMPNVIMPSVVILSVVMLNDTVPEGSKIGVIFLVI